MWYVQQLGYSNRTQPHGYVGPVGYKRCAMHVFTSVSEITPSVLQKLDTLWKVAAAGGFCLNKIKWIRR